RRRRITCKNSVSGVRGLHLQTPSQRTIRGRYGVYTFRPRDKNRKTGSNQRSFLKKGMVAGAVTVGAGLLVGGSSAPAQDENSEKNAGGLIKSDAAILRFLAAAEIIESDLGCSTRSSQVTRTMKSQLWPAADPRARLFRRALSFVPRKQTTRPWQQQIS